MSGEKFPETPIIIPNDTVVFVLTSETSDELRRVAGAWGIACDVQAIHHEKRSIYFYFNQNEKSLDELENLATILAQRTCLLTGELSAALIAGAHVDEFVRETTVIRPSSLSQTNDPLITLRTPNTSIESFMLSPLFARVRHSL